MKFGRFDDANREYVIDTPQTPYPWINYLGNEKFFSLISNTAGGYAFYTDARLRRLTRYRYNDVPPDNVKKARITRRFRGCEYVIDVVNRKSDGAIVLKLAAGRAKLAGTRVKAARGENKVRLVATVG